MKWQDKVTFTLSQDHTVNQLKSLESLQAEREQSESSASAMAQLAADFAIESDLLTSLTEALIEALGGLALETISEEEKATETV